MMVAGIQRSQNSKRINAIAFVLIEFSLPILLGLKDGVSACFVVWAIVKVIKQQEEQEPGL
jgi:xanthine/uracil/vitamin C permease (AzgA family)